VVHIFTAFIVDFTADFELNKGKPANNGIRRVCTFQMAFRTTHSFSSNKLTALCLMCYELEHKIESHVQFQSYLPMSVFLFS